MTRRAELQASHYQYPQGRPERRETRICLPADDPEELRVFPKECKVVVGALRIRDVPQAIAPYPRALDLIALLREEAKTPEQQALITDLFERITLYDLKVGEAKAAKRADGRRDVTVPVEAGKAYADGQGNERRAALNEPIEIGLFTAEPGSGGFGRGNVLKMELHPIRSGRQEIRFVTDRRPTHAGVDPYNLYIDRNSGDNVGVVVG